MLSAFIVCSCLQFSGEGLVQQRLLQRLQRGELALVEGFEALGFGSERIQVLKQMRRCSDKVGRQSEGANRANVLTVQLLNMPPSRYCFLNCFDAF